MKLSSTTALLLALTPLMAAASPIKGTAPTTASLGEPVTAVFEAELGPGETLILDLLKSATSYFAVTASIEEKPAASGARRWRVELVPLDLGKREIALHWNLKGASGESRPAAMTFPLDIKEPESAGGGQPELRDIKGPRAARPALWPWLLALLTAAAAYWAWKRRKPALPAPAAAPVEVRPPEVVAEAELAELEASGLWTEGRHKEFYLRLTEILRRYLERRCGVPATRLTTSELARALRRAELERGLLSLFKDLFDRADLVKFAKIPALPSWGAADLAAARRLVRETTPAAPVEAAR